MLSFEVMSAIQSERQKDFQREAQQRRLARLAQANHKSNRWHWLTQLLAAPVQTVHEVRETLELPQLSAEEFLVWEQRQRMYKRIAQGNALADAEVYSDQLRNGR